MPSTFNVYEVHKFNINEVSKLLDLTLQPANPTRADLTCWGQLEDLPWLSPPLPSSLGRETGKLTLTSREVDREKNI